jgi:hypothetical protein
MNGESNGWSARLYWQWILYNSVAFVVVLTAVAVLSWISADVLHLDLAHRNKLLALLVATVGALLFGGVLGSLQWLVIRERVPVPGSDGSWPASDPALGLAARDHARGDQCSGLRPERQRRVHARRQPDPGARTAAGLSQASVLRTYTRRWAWWIAANIVSWLIVDAVFYLLSQWFEALDFTRHDGSVAQVYLMLILSTPLTGRMLLWVLAPSAVLSQEPATALPD